MNKVNYAQLLAYRYLSDPKIKVVGYGGAAGGGKTGLGCEWLMRCGWAFPGTRWFVGRNNIKDSRESVLVTFDKVASYHGFKEYRFSNDGIDFRNGSRVSFLDLTYYPYKDPMFTRLGSKEYTGGWVEEAGEVHRLAVEVLKSRIGRHMNDVYRLEPKLLLTFNPAKGYLYDTFYKPHRDGRMPEDTAFVQAYVYDNPFITREYVEVLKNLKDPVLRKRLLLGEWEYEDDPSALCGYDAITDLFTNDFIEPEGAKSCSADIAGKGHDRFIALSGVGNVFRVAIDEVYSPGRQVEMQLRDLMIRDGIPRSLTVVDADGVGSFLESYLTGIKEFHGGGRPHDSRYKNLKSECAFLLADMVNNRKIKIVCTPEQRERITEEFGVLKQARIDNDTSKKAIISKEEMKSILGRSPDYLDAFIMAMSFRLVSAGSVPETKVYSLHDLQR